MDRDPNMMWGRLYGYDEDEVGFRVRVGSRVP